MTRTLLSKGYSSVAPPVRFRDESGVQVDVIPFGDREKVDLALGVEVVHGLDVGMVEAAERERFAAEALARRVVGQRTVG